MVSCVPMSTAGKMADAMNGMHVIDKTGLDFGSVDGVDIDPTTWRVTGIVIKVRREIVDRLPMSKPILGEPRIEIATDRIKNMSDNLLLNVGVADIASLLAGSR